MSRFKPYLPSFVVILDDKQKVLLTVLKEEKYDQPHMSVDYSTWITVFRKSLKDPTVLHIGSNWPFKESYFSFLLKQVKHREKWV